MRFILILLQIILLSIKHFFTEINFGKFSKNIIDYLCPVCLLILDLLIQSPRSAAASLSVDSRDL